MPGSATFSTARRKLVRRASSSSSFASMPRGQQPQQQSAIQKWTLVRPDTLRGLLSARQKGPRHRHHHHQPAALNEKKKARPPSPPPGLVDNDVPSPDAGDGATQWSAWDVSHAASKPRPVAPGKRRRRGEGGFYRTSVIHTYIHCICLVVPGGSSHWEPMRLALVLLVCVYFLVDFY